VCQYEEFLFTECLEHKKTLNSVGYVSEKIVDGFLAGAVPIYAGASQVDEIFNTEAFVHADVSSLPGMLATAAKVVKLMENRTEYERMRRVEPLMSNETLQKFFSWHPAVWGTHGDGLRRRIVDEVLMHCGRISSKRGGGSQGFSGVAVVP